MKNKYSEIQVLRAIAIIYVLIEHGARSIFRDSETQQYLTSHVFALWGGVDIFFAIAGYLLYRSVTSLKQKGLSLSEIVTVFWIKRAWRLWPVAWGLAFFSFVFVAILCPKYINSDFLLSIFSNWLGILLNIQNFMVYQSHIGMGFHTNFYEVYWSLSLEEQLYVIFSIVVVLFKPRLGAVLCAFLIFVQIFIHRPALSDSVWWYIRSDAFCWGVLLGYFTENKERFKKLEPTFLKNRKLSSSAFIFLLIVIATPQLMYGCSFYLSIISLASGVLVFLACYDEGYIPVTGRTKQFLVKIGDYSYSLYLVHMPLIIIANYYMPDGSKHGLLGTIVFVMYLLISFLLSSLVCKYVESKYKEHGRNLAGNYLSKIKGRKNSE